MNGISTQTLVEILLLVPTALCAGFVVFIAGVIQGVMNDLDEAAFKRFLTLLHTRALKSPYAIAVSSMTFLGTIPYFVFYGIGNRWYAAGLILWVIASIVSKATALPIYARVDAIEASDTARLKEERRKLQTANLVRAALSFASVVLMVIGFI
ncbi:MAG: hypothetical protein EG826_08340 [Deltaproteobacteria bacterium]|nr:hypothetical protein [Deltaproteobacteria bacterium]